MIKFLLIFFLVSCGSTPLLSKVDPNKYYRHDLCVTYETGKQVKAKIKNFFQRFKKGKYRKYQVINEKITICGTGVLPYMDEYKITVKAKENVKFFLMKSCHEENTTANPNQGMLLKKDKLHMTYTPTLEKGEACPLFLASYSKKDPHETALLVFEHPDYKLDATVYCNGYTRHYKGVAICHSRQGLLQKIDFNEPVMIGKPTLGPAGQAKGSKGCPVLPLEPNKKSTGLFKMPPRECIYPIIGIQSENILQFYTSGYEGIIVRD